MTASEAHQSYIDERIFVAGHRGLVGSALTRKISEAGRGALILRSRDTLDLTNQSEVADFFSLERPEVVILAAAKVGGILANLRNPVEFLETNLRIQLNVISAAASHGVSKFIFLGSSCIYPRDCKQPIKEEYLLTDVLEPSNRGYALAKITGIELCNSYNRESGTQFVSLMPTNLYGIGDNYSPEGSHVIPGLIRRIYEAKVKGLDSVTIWGTGAPRREFLFSEDLADACLFVLDNMTEVHNHLEEKLTIPVLNIGSGQEVSIREIALTICNIIGFGGRLEFDHSKPDGAPRKWLDTKTMSDLGWTASTPLEAGLKLAYQDFCQRYGSEIENR